MWVLVTNTFYCGQIDTPYWREVYEEVIYVKWRAGGTRADEVLAGERRGNVCQRVCIQYGSDD